MAARVRASSAVATAASSHTRSQVSKDTPKQLHKHHRYAQIGPNNSLIGRTVANIACALSANTSSRSHLQDSPNSGHCSNCSQFTGFGDQGLGFRVWGLGFRVI